LKVLEDAGDGGEEALLHPIAAAVGVGKKKKKKKKEDALDREEREEGKHLAFPLSVRKRRNRLLKPCKRKKKGIDRLLVSPSPDASKKRGVRMPD